LTARLTPLSSRGMAIRAWPVLLALGCSSEPLLPSGSAPDVQATPTATTTAPSPYDDSPFQPIEDYPAGPYGTGVGAVIENLSFLGWRDPVAAGYDTALLETITFGDFYDPTGTRLKLIVVNASAIWCAYCQAEMRDMKTNGTDAEYREKGVQVIGTLFQDGQARPAKPDDLAVWGSLSAHSITFPLLLDPALKLGGYFTSDATPLNLIIDATTMRIVRAVMGYDNNPTSGFWAIVDEELERRGAPVP